MFWVLILLLFFPISAIFINTMPYSGRAHMTPSSKAIRPAAIPVREAAGPSVPALPAVETAFGKERIKGIYFYGEGKPLSRVEGDSLVLAAEGSSSWAYARLVLREELDLWNDSIAFLARCEEGKEILKVGMMDNTMRTMPEKNNFFIKLTSDWQKVVIGRDRVRTGGIDESKVVSINFIINADSGPQKSVSKIYIKDFRIFQKDNEFN